MLAGQEAKVAADGEPMDDWAAITPTTAVKVAAGCTILAGVLALVLALQAGALLEVRGAFRAVIAVFATLGAAAVAGGYRISRLRSGSALWCAVVAACISVSALGWFVLALLSGVFILLALPLMPLSAIGAIAAFSSIKTLQRAAAARSRMRAEGLDAGL